MTTTTTTKPNASTTTRSSRWIDRFGEGEYRYFARPFPEPIEQLKQALYPRLLPIARDWWNKLGRPAPWPDTLDEWLAMCHAAGQTKSTPIPLKYPEKDWNAPVRHGVSAIRSGQRCTLALVFHDAA